MDLDDFGSLAYRETIIFDLPILLKDNGLATTSVIRLMRSDFDIMGHFPNILMNFRQAACYMKLLEAEIAYTGLHPITGKPFFAGTKPHPDLITDVVCLVGDFQFYYLGRVKSIEAANLRKKAISLYNSGIQLPFEKLSFGNGEYILGKFESNSFNSDDFIIMTKAMIDVSGKRYNVGHVPKKQKCEIRNNYLKIARSLCICPNTGYRVVRDGFRNLLSKATHITGKMFNHHTFNAFSKDDSILDHLDAECVGNELLRDVYAVLLANEYDDGGWHPITGKWCYEDPLPLMQVNFHVACDGRLIRFTSDVFAPMAYEIRSLFLKERPEGQSGLFYYNGQFLNWEAVDIASFKIPQKRILSFRVPAKYRSLYGELTSLYIGTYSVGKPWDSAYCLAQNGNFNYHPKTCKSLIAEGKTFWDIEGVEEKLISKGLDNAIKAKKANS